MSQVPHSYPWHRPPTADARRSGSMWSVTYGDLMSLLVCIFVLLVTISPPAVAEDARYRSVVDSLRSVFGAARGDAGQSEAGAVTLVEQLVTASETAGSAVAPVGLFRCSHEPDGVHVMVAGERAFLDDSSAGLVPEADAALRRLAEHWRGLDAAVDVYGFVGAKTTSDNQEFDHGFRRARVVADVLSQCGVPIDRFHVGTARPPQHAPTGSGRPTRGARDVELVLRIDEPSADAPDRASGQRLQQE